MSEDRPIANNAQIGIGCVEQQRLFGANELVATGIRFLMSLVQSIDTRETLKHRLGHGDAQLVEERSVAVAAALAAEGVLFPQIGAGNRRQKLGPGGPDVLVGRFVTRPFRLEARVDGIGRPHGFFERLGGYSCAGKGQADQ